jgi:hypothetical protein
MASTYTGSEETRNTVLTVVRSFLDATSSKAKSGGSAKDFALTEGFHAVNYMGHFHSAKIGDILLQKDGTLGSGQMSDSELQLGNPEPEIFIHDDKFAALCTGLAQQRPNGDTPPNRTYAIFVLMKIHGDWKIVGVCGSQVPFNGPLEPPIADTASDEVLAPIHAQLEQIARRKVDDSEDWLLPGARGTFYRPPGEPRHQTMEAHYAEVKKIMETLPPDAVHEFKHFEPVTRVCEAGDGVGGGKMAMRWTKHSRSLDGKLISTGLGFFALFKSDGGDKWRLGAAATFGDEIESG